MEGGMKCIKYLMFIFNLVFALTGLALIITGAVVQTAYSEYLDFLGQKYLSAPMLFIVIGVVIFLVAFFGCCGAIRENHCMIITFSVFLALIFVCELAGGIAGYVLRSDVRVLLENNMEESLRNYNVTGKEGVTKTWDAVQHEFTCCGVKNYQDWNITDVATDVATDVPDSCCKIWVAGCGAGKLLTPDSTINTEGCLDGLEDFVKHKTGIFAGVGIAIAFIQLVGIVFACMLAGAVKRQYQTV